VDEAGAFHKISRIDDSRLAVRADSTFFLNSEPMSSSIAIGAPWPPRGPSFTILE
jgi:hypothetical protein